MLPNMETTWHSSSDPPYPPPGSQDCVPDTPFFHYSGALPLTRRRPVSPERCN